MKKYIFLIINIFLISFLLSCEKDTNPTIVKNILKSDKISDNNNIFPNINKFLPTKEEYLVKYDSILYHIQREIDEKLIYYNYSYGKTEPDVILNIHKIIYKMHFNPQIADSMYNNFYEPNFWDAYYGNYTYEEQTQYQNQVFSEIGEYLVNLDYDTFFEKSDEYLLNKFDLIYDNKTLNVYEKDEILSGIVALRGHLKTVKMYPDVYSWYTPEYLPKWASCLLSGSAGFITGAATGLKFASSVGPGLITMGVITTGGTGVVVLVSVSVAGGGFTGAYAGLVANKCL